MKRLVLALGLLLVVLLPGCSTLHLYAPGEPHVMLTRPSVQVQEVRDFQFSKSVVYTLYQPYNVSNIVEEAVQNAHADAIVNVTIAVKENLLQSMVNVATLGLVRLNTVTVRGKLIRTPNGLAESKTNPRSFDLAHAEGQR